MINSRVPSNLLISRIATDIVQKQNSLAAVQEQISTGKKINRPSDAPAESAHLVTMKETVAQLEQFNKNTAIAESKLSLEEAALSGTTSVLNRVRELTLRVSNGVVNDSFRAEINSEVKLALEELYTLANSQDSFGNFLFGGSNIKQRPFSEGVPVNYAGSDESTKLEIALNRTIVTGDAGTDVFMRIRSGNGDFQTNSEPTNIGTGRISRGAISDASVFDGTPYSISFTSATNYDIVNADTGAVAVAGETYEPGKNIQINGMTTSIEGAPEAGDTFSIQASEYRDIFSSVSGLIDALDAPQTDPVTDAHLRSSIDNAIGEIDNSLNHINTMRARVGTRLSSIDSSREENSNVALQIERTKSSVEDVDIADAVTRLQVQANSLEILQKSFTRLEGLSLFNYM